MLLLLREHLEIGETGSFDRSRAAGIAGEPNMTASFINLSVFLFAGLFLYFWKRPLAWAGAFASLLGFRGIMVTYSRGGYLGFAAGLLALSFYRSKILFLILLAAAGIAVLKPAYLPAPIRARMEATFEHKAHGEVGLEKSAGDRVLIWRGALRLIREYPVFGTGFDLFEKRVAPFWSGTRPFNAHNAYLMVAAETGIPSLVIFLSLLGLFFKSAQRLMTETKDLQVKGVCLGFLAGLSAFMMQNLYIDSFSWQEVSLYLWVMIAVIGAALAGMNKKVSAEVPS
ncbi:MAG: hypothetical protein COW13_01215 [Candidatus Omnitrophica bacterium CG12_big_fil_rev_8_21_14_0_65_50_5]|nr:MAG: hypothetical protein COW13_01215 [Candidatus Omnitrophica bacterium CG12_big_fil_rev_8_21_14_0_65_50_5]